MSGRIRTAYELLGVAPTASGAQIRAAYLELIARYHPDRHAGHPLAGLAADRAAELNEAYRILSDPGRRAVHDEDIRLAATTASARSRVAREAGALVILLRALAIGVALVLVVRLAPILWRAIGGLIGAPSRGWPVPPERRWRWSCRWPSSPASPSGCCGSAAGRRRSHTDDPAGVPCGTAFGIGCQRLRAASECVTRIGSSMFAGVLLGLLVAGEVTGALMVSAASDPGAPCQAAQGLALALQRRLPGTRVGVGKAAAVGDLGVTLEPAGQGDGRWRLRVAKPDGRGGAAARGATGRARLCGRCRDVRAYRRSVPVRHRLARARAAGGAGVPAGGRGPGGGAGGVGRAAG